MKQRLTRIVTFMQMHAEVLNERYFKNKDGFQAQLLVGPSLDSQRNWKVNDIARESIWGEGQIRFVSCCTIPCACVWICRGLEEIKTKDERLH